MSKCISRGALIKLCGYLPQKCASIDSGIEKCPCIAIYHGSEWHVTQGISRDRESQRQRGRRSADKEGERGVEMSIIRVTSRRQIEEEQQCSEW